MQTPDGNDDRHPTAGREALSRMVSCLHASHSSPTNSGYNGGTASERFSLFVGKLRLHTSVCLVFSIFSSYSSLGLSIPCRRNILTQLKCRNYWRQTMNLIKISCIIVSYIIEISPFSVFRCQVNSSFVSRCSPG